MPGLSKRTLGLGTENAFVVLKEVQELVAQGKDVVNFCIGQPDFDTPANVKEAACRAIRDGKTGYTPSAGIPELREAVADEIRRTRGLEVSAADVVVAAGAKPFIGYTVASVTDAGRGEQVLYPNPGFPIYSSQIAAQGAVGVPLHLEESRGYVFDVEKLEKAVTASTRLLILNSPQNPTGGVMSGEELARVARIAIERDLWVYSDEPYSRILFDGEFRSIASQPGMAERTIVVDGVSKSYAMPGWRIGYAVSRPLAPHLATWITNTESCAAQPSQWAALEALTGPQEDSLAMVESFRKRRDVIVDGLNRVEGVRCLKPGGAFYVWPNVTELCARAGVAGSEALRRRLLHEAGIGVLADAHFGSPVPGGGEHLRFSYATSTQNIEKGLERLADFAARAAKGSRRS